MIPRPLPDEQLQEARDQVGPGRASDVAEHLNPPVYLFRAARHTMVLLDGDRIRAEEVAAAMTNLEVDGVRLGRRAGHGDRHARMRRTPTRVRGLKVRRAAYSCCSE